MEYSFDNNFVKLLGRLETPFVFNHEINGEKIYTSAILVKRTSGVVDRIPIMARENQIFELSHDILEKKIFFEGYLVTYMKFDEKVVAVRVKSDIFIKENFEEDVNYISLGGTIESTPTIRKTLNKSSVCNFLLATRRKYNKKNYINAVAWGNIADQIFVASKGTRICIKGRLQSKIKKGFNEYSINIDDDDYEVAIYYLRWLCIRGEQVGEK